MNRSSRLSSSNKPVLAVYYESAHKQVLDRKCFIRPKEYSLFEVFMDDLRELNIGYRDYAYGIVTILKEWLKEKKFYRIPVNVFCGDWALGKFRKVDNSQYVTVDEPDKDEKIEIFESELLVARTYIESNLSDVCRMKEIVADLKPLLSKKWLSCPADKKPVSEVLDVLCKEYGVRVASDYNDLIRSARCRR